MLTMRIGLRVLVELRPGHHLDHLLERADAAGERDEGVGALEHDALPLMHVGGDDQLAAPRCSITSRSLRNCGMMPVTSPPLGQDRAGEDAHQPDGAAAIDQADAASPPWRRRASRAAAAKAGSRPAFEPQ